MRLLPYVDLRWITVRHPEDVPLARSQRLRYLWLSRHLRIELNHMLEEFAARQGFTNIVHFTDDGISGTCFDRPGFLAMMKEVEAGNVEYLCIKDMSRMGRDYLKVGQIMEILRQRGVRLSPSMTAWTVPEGTMILPLSATL